MDTAKINYYNDVLLGISFAVVFVTAILTLFKVITFTILQVHKFAGIAMIVFALVHFVLHFNAIVNMTKARFCKK